MSNYQKYKTEIWRIGEIMLFAIGFFAAWYYTSLDNVRATENNTKTLVDYGQKIDKNTTCLEGLRVGSNGFNSSQEKEDVISAIKSYRASGITFEQTADHVNNVHKDHMPISDKDLRYVTRKEYELSIEYIKDALKRIEKRNGFN